MCILGISFIKLSFRRAESLDQRNKLLCMYIKFDTLNNILNETTTFHNGFIISQ